MRIFDIVDLLYGEMISQGNMSACKNLICKVENVNIGDAFFAFSESDIAQAIKQGAYAIITDYDTQIKDKEISYIKINNLQNAISKLIKQLLMINNIGLIFVHRIESILLNSIKHHDYCHFMTDDGDIFSSFLEFLSQNKDEKYIITSHIILKDLALNATCSPSILNDECKNANIIENAKLKTISFNLLESKVEFDTKIYHFIIPNNMIKFIENLISLFLQTKLDISHILQTHIFIRPIFLDTNFKITHESSAFLMFINENIINAYIYAHIRQYAPHLKIIMLEKISQKTKADSNIESIIFKQSSEILNIFKNNKFNVAILNDVNKNEIINEINAIKDKNDNKENLLF